MSRRKKNPLPIHAEEAYHEATMTAVEIVRLLAREKPPLPPSFVKLLKPLLDRFARAGSTFNKATAMFRLDLAGGWPPKEGS